MKLTLTDVATTKFQINNIVCTNMQKQSVKKVFLKISQNSQKKHLCTSLFSDNVAGRQPANLSKKSLRHRCFPVNFAKFLRTSFFIEHIRWLLLFWPER